LYRCTLKSFKREWKVDLVAVAVIHHNTCAKSFKREWKETFLLCCCWLCMFCREEFQERMERGTPSRLRKRPLWLEEFQERMESLFFLNTLLEARLPTGRVSRENGKVDVVERTFRVGCDDDEEFQERMERVGSPTPSLSRAERGKSLKREWTTRSSGEEELGTRGVSRENGKLEEHRKIKRFQT